MKHQRCQTTLCRSKSSIALFSERIGKYSCLYSLTLFDGIISYDDNVGLMIGFIVFVCWSVSDNYWPTDGDRLIVACTQ
jgi:hypothetical protein